MDCVSLIFKKMLIYLFVYANNYKTLANFTRLLNKINYTRKTKLKLFLTQTQNKKQSKIFTVLKSPHVNKKAQEHFKLLKYTKKIKLCSFKLSKLLILLKKVHHHLFPNMHLKVKVMLLNSDTKKDLLDPNIFILNNSKKLLKANSSTYLKIVDSFGEVLLKKDFTSKNITLKSLDSSAGRAKD